MNHLSSMLLTIVALLGACARESSPASAPPATPTAAEALDRMDARAPVPLLPMMANHQKQNMRDHLVAVQEIVAALGSDDYAAVERAASRIGTSDQMTQSCSHMGAAAPGFTEQALAFHQTADRIAQAARDGDRARVASELATTLQACTGCHATWKQQVVDEPTWNRLAGGPAPTHGR